jgi:hypothetical protein
VGFFRRKPGLTVEGLQLELRAGFSPAVGLRAPIDIVGESFYQDHIRAVVNLVGSNAFPIYLQPEPNNKYDKNAVAIMTNYSCIGHIARDDAKAWQQKALAAASRNCVLTGSVVAKSKSGQIYGIFGNATSPHNPMILAGIEPKRLNDLKITKAVELVHEAFEDEPETRTQQRAQVKKAVKAGLLLFAHVSSFPVEDEMHNPALVDLCRTFVLDVEATSDMNPASRITEDVIDTFLDDWYFQIGSDRY